MIRRYCDCCKAEISRELGNAGRCLVAPVNHGEVNGEVEVVRRGAWDGDVCKYCILDALYEMDDRPAKDAFGGHYEDLRTALGVHNMMNHQAAIDKAKAARSALDAERSADGEASVTPMGCFRGPEFKDSRDVGR